MTESRPSRPDHVERADAERTAKTTADSDANEALHARLRAFEEAADGYGPAFLAYLELDVPEPVDGSELTDFLDRYIGYYPDRWSFIRTRLDYLGWSQSVAGFKAEHGIWSDDLAWNPDALWEHLSETHGLVEQFGGVYAFRR